MGRVKQGLNRRKLLQSVGAGSAITLAGCSGSSNNGNGDGNDNGNNKNTSSNNGTGGGDIKSGGKPVIGLNGEPKGYNPLVISDATSFALIDRMYIHTTARDPSDPTKIIPYAFSDWSFDSKDLTGTAKITKGFKWSDGKKFTADDVAFTFNYLLDNEGHRYESNVTPLKSVTKTGDYSIKFEMAKETSALFTPDVGTFSPPILPKHVWKDVDDYTKYAPKELIGAGGFKLDDYSKGNWYELKAVPDNVPDEISKGPYVDTLRFSVFGDMTSMINALKKGDVDMIYTYISPTRALQLQKNNSAKVWKAPTRGYNYVAHNLRRVPLDDKPFRQSLGFVFPFKYLIQTLRKTLSEPGEYVAAKAYKDWWPKDYDTPMSHGPYRTKDGQLDVEKARSFLENASGKHKYTFGPKKSSHVTGSKEIRIDGKLLTDAHTNNDGKAGQGPLQLMYTPPKSSPIQARAMAKFIGNLNEVGIPTEAKAVASNTQTTLVWAKEDFDMWASDWIYMPQPHFYMGFWLSSSAADMQGNSNSAHINAMRYTGADDIINKETYTYDPKKQKQYAAKALAQVYEDSPVLVTEYPNRLQATGNDYTGWVKMPGGISQNPWSFLNVHKSQ